MIVRSVGEEISMKRWVSLTSVAGIGLAVLFAAVSSAVLAEKRQPTDEVKLSPTESFILEETNKARAAEKLPPLKLNRILMKVARAHSENMARQHKMEHVLDGKKPSQRVAEAGYDYHYTGENVAYGFGGFGAEDVFEGWMKSPGHRKNILDKNYKEIGIGVATDDKGATYYTQEFGTRR